MRLSHVSIALVSATLALGGCSSKALLVTPAGFAQIDGGKYDYRATNPDGVVVGVRTHKNDMHGNLDFWTRVLSKNLEDQSYKPDPGKARTLKTEEGVEGRQIRYTLTSGGREEKYWLTLFVTKDRIYVVEAGGDTAFFDQDVAPKVEAAIASLKMS
jgi:hypothetical protein